MNILRLPKLKEKVGMCKSRIYAGVRNCTFPAPISLSDDGRAKGWVEAEVDAWIAGRIKSSRQTVECSDSIEITMQNGGA